MMVGQGDFIIASFAGDPVQRAAAKKSAGRAGVGNFGRSNGLRNIDNRRVKRNFELIAKSLQFLSGKCFTEPGVDGEGAEREWSGRMTADLGKNVGEKQTVFATG